MKFLYKNVFFLIRFSILFSVGISSNAFSQQKKLSDYVLFAGFGPCPGSPGIVAPFAPGCAVQVTNNSIVNGSTGSHNLVLSLGIVQFNGNINSGGPVRLGSLTVVRGNTSAANTSGKTGNILKRHREYVY